MPKNYHQEHEFYHQEHNFHHQEHKFRNQEREFYHQGHDFHHQEHDFQWILGNEGFKRDNYKAIRGNLKGIMDNEPRKTLLLR